MSKWLARLKTNPQEYLPDQVLEDTLPHGPCYQCGTDTQSMLTRPDRSWGWMCVPCFDLGARPLPDTQKAVTGEMVMPI
jgi:hypothetical protein